MKSTIHHALRAASDTLDDVEDLRIATENRYRMLTRDVADKDGHVRGYGLDERDPIVALTGATLDALKEQEHNLTLQIQREVRKTPFAGWVKAQKGIGEKQAARMLAALGDPYLNESTGQPRTVSQLWAYSGYGRIDNGVTRRAAKGMSQEDLFKLGNRDVKMRLYLIANSCVKALGGEYRELYEDEKIIQLDKVHNAPCPQCHSKEAGTPLKPGHQHARALRKISKTILKDLYVIAEAHHNSETPS